MPSIESFATKRGTARFEDSKILLESSVAGYLRSLYRDYWKSDAWWRRAIFLGYVLWVVFAIGWSARLVVLLVQRDADPIWAAGGAGVVAALLVALWLANYLRGYRSPDRIALDDVESVTATRGERGLTRPRLVLAYRDGDATRKRRVNLPSLLMPDGAETYERAVTAFVERGIDVTGDRAGVVDPDAGDGNDAAAPDAGP
ncbi:hypothetical protein [Halarchaeum nitratireducens]|uniref:Uncharacterized protein n=1 Tax=Halarchaeum nitratireducens TaxID=489913 RepID=A0A830G8H6_9EURY|nr:MULTISPECIES: hypothetical protein [Halarchaeum]MBP2250053.1 hypothetical protein [Halarchaeum solikamskense]GGN08852.1 hypothetical protein GCM10009021_05300 [Halarchaeum nitratireducens]